MTRYYSVVQGERDLIHLTLTPAGDGIWPHTLCGLKTDTTGDVDDMPNCLGCIGAAVNYDNAMEQAFADGRAVSTTNPCGEIWLGGPWSGIMGR